MNDIRRLNDKLAKLGDSEHRTSDGAREISFTGKNELLLAILHEIDETILARELVFANKTGQKLSLEVANRRLLRLKDQSGDTDIPSYHADLAHPFSEPDTSVIEALAELLCKFMEGSDALNVTPQKLVRVTAPSEIGLSPEVLALTWAINFYGSDSTTTARQIEKFITSCADFTLASVEFGPDEIIEITGPEPETERLIDLAQDGLNQLDENLRKCFQDAASSFFVVPGLGSDTSQSIAYVGCGTSRALMMVASENLNNVNSVWRQQNES